MHEDIGFQPDHLLTFRFETPDSRYEKTRLQFNRDYFERLRALPGVQSAAGTMFLPMTDDNAEVSFQNPEHPMPEGQLPSADISLITPNYFRTMQTPLLKGRDFTRRGHAGCAAGHDHQPGVCAKSIFRTKTRSARN